MSPIKRRPTNRCTVVDPKPGPAKVKHILIPGGKIMPTFVYPCDIEPPESKANGLIHPLSIVLALRSLVDDDTIIASDMGSHHIWMARHFFEFEPRKLLFSDGQQTLGVGIPWAMAANLIYPGKKAVKAQFVRKDFNRERRLRNDSPQ